MKIFKNTFQWLNTAKPTKPVTTEDKIKMVKQIAIWVQEELDELITGLQEENLEEVYDGIIDANIFLANLPYFLSLDLDYLSKYADKVNLSNISKYCISEEEAQLTVDLYKSGTHPDKMGVKIHTYYVQEGEYFIVKQTVDNKIMKSFMYVEPNQF